MPEPGTKVQRLRKRVFCENSAKRSFGERSHLKFSQKIWGRADQSRKASAMAAQRTSTGSTPTENRMNPGATASPQRARRSPAEWVPPKVVVWVT
jgi:hypothetical protein